MRFGKTFGSMIAVACLATFGSNAANAAFFTNGSFEVGTATPGRQLSNVSTVITGWVVINTIDWVGSEWKASDGDNSIDLSGSSRGGISQAFDTIENTVYVVTFDLAGNPYPLDTERIKRASVSASGNAARDYLFDTTNTTSSNMGWVNMTYTFTATTTMTKLTFTSGTDTRSGPALDNVVVTAQAPAGPPSAVPVPAGMLLALTGLPMFGVMGWARQRKHIAA